MKKILALAISLLLISLLSATAIMASDITGAHWRGIIRIANSGTAASYVTTNFTVNTTSMISNGYMDDGTDAVIQSSGVDVPFMPGYGTNTWFMFVESIGAGQNLNYEIFTDNVTGGKTVYFPGATGMSISDNASLEPGTWDYSVNISGFFNTDAAYLSEIILQKSLVFALSVGNSNNITLSWYPGPAYLNINCPTGEHDIVISANTTHVKLTVDSASTDIARPGASPNNANAFEVGADDTTRYIESFAISTNGTVRCNTPWEYGSTFTDLSGNGNPATPTFPTTASDADVTADLLSLYPVSESEYLAATELSASTGIVLGTPDAPIELYTDEDYSKIPFADAINAMIDASGTSATDRLPRVMWWFPFIYGTIAIAGLCIYGVTRHEGSTGTLWAPVIVIEVGYIIAGLLNPIGFFGAVLFLIPAITCLTADKHYSMG